MFNTLHGNINPLTVQRGVGRHCSTIDILYTYGSNRSRVHCALAHVTVVVGYRSRIWSVRIHVLGFVSVSGSGCIYVHRSVLVSGSGRIYVLGSVLVFGSGRICVLGSVLVSGSGRICVFGSVLVSGSGRICVLGSVLVSGSGRICVFGSVLVSGSGRIYVLGFGFPGVFTFSGSECLSRPPQKIYLWPSGRLYWSGKNSFGVSGAPYLERRLLIGARFWRCQYRSIAVSPTV